MKTKNPKCIKCGKVMKVIYTKRSYKLNGKYRTYWSKEGYVCNHIHYPFAILTPIKHKELSSKYLSYLVSIYDIDNRKLLKSLKKIFNFLI